MALKKPFERLSRDIIPKNYNLELKPDLKLFSFEGIVSIHIVIATNTKKIILNCLDLSIKTVSFSTSNAKRLQPIDTAISVHDQTATFIFIDDLPIGEGTLVIEFKGTLNDKLQGFYRSKYVATNGEERYSAVTQFQVAQARRAFPCWDEPEFKATFNISLNIPGDRIAISNMSILSEMADGTGNKTVKFNTTPVMSTYIVAFIVGEYDFVEDKSKDGVTVRVYTPLGKKEQGLFALAVATKVLPYYKDYFNIAYPLPKLDLIALADLSLSAMENWGLVTYREKCLLVDPQNSSAFSKQWTALTIGHELAHMWFGNLVTMEWWTDLWLNEGYATFIEFLCVNHVFPEYDIWTQFVTDTFIRALELDRLNNSHQIEIPVGHPSEIDEIFDDISYQKGASIIRMLHDYIGEEDFRKGLNLYLTRHQYKNTSTVDLWAALAEASQKPIGAIMSTWTKQVGFPIIQVFSKQQGTGRVLTLNQDKYTADGSKGSDDSLWMVPITISIQGQPNKPLKSLVLEKKTQEIEIENISPESWIKLNPGTVGYYRTLYPTEMLNQLVSAVRDTTLPPLDRLGLLDDSFAMVQAGHMSSVEFLNLLEAYTEETNYTVWSSISNSLSQFISVFSHIELHKSLNDFARKLFSKIHKRLGWEAKADENHLDILLRSLVIGRMIAFEDPGAIIEAKERFELHVLGTKLLPADLRTPCYEAALTGSDSDETREEVFTQLLDLYRTEQLQEEKLRISRALASVKSPKLLQRVLEFSISNDVRYQDSTFIIAAVAFNVHGRDMAWDFFKDNWRIFIDRYQGGFLLFRLIKSVAQNLLPEGKAHDVEDFFNTHPTPGAERTILQCLEMISLNVAWLSRDQDSVKVYLKNYQ